MAFHDWECTQAPTIIERVSFLKSFLKRNAWWKSVMDAYHVMMPIMFAICVLDQRIPNIGTLWMTWWIVQRSLEYLEKLKEYVVEKHWCIPFSSRQRKVLLKYFHAK